MSKVILIGAGGVKMRSNLWKTSVWANRDRLCNSKGDRVKSELFGHESNNSFFLRV